MSHWQESALKQQVEDLRIKLDRAEKKLEAVRRYAENMQEYYVGRYIALDILDILEEGETNG